ncbi:MAG: vanadium-dependent haloperoxidase [Phycisphaerales bacterium]
MRSNWAWGLVAAAGLCGAASGDVVTEWIDTYLAVTRLSGGAPCPISRSGPMLCLVMFDAVNAIDRVEQFPASFKPYLSGLPIPAAGTSREAAAAAAAYTVMAGTHPLQSDDQPMIGVLIQSRYDEQLANIPDGPAKANGIALGESIGATMLLLRHEDGYDADPSYTLGGQPGDWCPTPDAPVLQPFTPHWGNVMPWGIERGDQFRPTRLTNYGSMSALLQSSEYAAQLNGGPGVPGVRDLGARNSVSRTADQTEAAWFWANDRDGTSKPPGQLLQITKVVSANENLSLSQNARLFGLVALAMGDACVTAWDAKYNTPIDLWRPIDAVRETINDGNPDTVADPSWLPLADFTPPFPAYVSGHATFAAVHASIMAHYFGTDAKTFTIGSDEFAAHPSLGYPANLTRTFTSFSQAAWENAMSRIWLGVHYYWDATDGVSLGNQVGDFVFAHRLRPVRSGPCLADLNVDSLVEDSDFVQFSMQYDQFDCASSLMPGDCSGDLNSDGFVDDSDFVIFSTAYDAYLCDQ